MLSANAGNSASDTHNSRGTFIERSYPSVVIEIVSDIPDLLARSDSKIGKPTSNAPSSLTMLRSVGR
jgi:hypothetical protein